MTLLTRAAAASVLLALSAGTPALAQTPPAAPPAAMSRPATPDAPVPPAPIPPTPADPAAPAGTAPMAAAPAQPDISPAKLAIAREVVLSSGMGRSFDPMVPNLMDQIPRVVTRTRPELAKDLAAVLVQLQPEFEKKGGEMTDIAARIYARRMSDDELKATAAFFESPAGRRYVASQPLMLDELVIAMQSWAQEISTYMMKRVQVEMEKKGDKF